MNPWHRGQMVAYDTETTAPDPNLARIVTATIALIDGRDGIVWTRSWLLNPGCDIPEGAAAIHGISTEHAREHGQDPEAGMREITDELHTAAANGVPLVAFNAAYDFTVTARECVRNGGLTIPSPYVVDPHVIDKQLDRYRRGKRTLTAVCEHYGVRLDGAHDATEDALAAARVAWVLAERHPRELQIDLADLHASQQSWRADQAAGLQAYFRRKDPNAVVEPGWPIQACPADWSPEQLPAEREEAAA